MCTISHDPTKTHHSTPKSVTPYDVRDKASLPVTGHLGKADVDSIFNRSLDSMFSVTMNGSTSRWFGMQYNFIFLFSFLYLIFFFLLIVSFSICFDRN